MPNVLVIEDDLNLQESLLETLEDGGYFTSGAASADQALQLARKITFDLVVSDVRMAGSTDGLGALTALKGRTPELRCIVITGFASQDAPKQAMAIRVDDYLYKPFRSADLLATVKRVMASGQERTGYWALASRLLAAPKRLLEYAESSRREGATRQLEGQRDRAMQTFFVGIRSKLISRGASLDVWDRMERLEERYQQLLCGAAPTDLALLVEGYRQLGELMQAMAQSDAIGSLKGRQDWQVDRATFARFYDRLQTGRIGQEQLRIACNVWRSSAGDRQASAELADLYRLMWEG